jgi:hypothetical protein
MSTGAKVRSIDTLRDFRVAMSNFGCAASQAMAAVDVEIRRTLDWLKHDQVKFWQQEVRRREDAVGEARQDLSRCLISTSAGGTQASCTDQKVALEKAKKRLDQAREKVEIVKRWGQIVEQEVGDYRGPAQQLATLIDGDLPRAMALLARKIQALEEYANLMSEGSSAGPSPQTSSANVTTSTVARKPAEPEPTPEQVLGMEAPAADGSRSASPPNP